MTSIQTQFVVCIQCGQEFEFPPDEQARYLDRGFDAPRRCPACRRNKSRHSGNGQERRRNGKKRDYRMKYE